MLSKSQARFFFLGGTVLFSGLFIGLTIDSVRQNPQRTNEQNLTEAVKRGKHIWEDNNCMGCHTLLGEGAYYAPDLTKVVKRRGPAWIRTFIRDPEAMFPGERKMVKYDFSEEQISDVIAFLAWVGEIDTNGWPPDPDLANTQKPVVAQASVNIDTAPQKYKQLCVACHAVGGKGGNVGPALDGVASRLKPNYLRKWLKDPQKVKPGTNMPQLPLEESEIKDIVQFLSTLK